MKVPWWCMGKTRYETKAEAMYRVKRQCKDCHRGRKKGWAGSQIMTSYKCSTCGYWHVGGTSKSAVQRSDKNGHIIRKKRPLTVATTAVQLAHGKPMQDLSGGEARHRVLEAEHQAWPHGRVQDVFEGSDEEVDGHEQGSVSGIKSGGYAPLPDQGPEAVAAVRGESEGQESGDGFRSGS